MIWTRKRKAVLVALFLCEEENKINTRDVMHSFLVNDLAKLYLSSKNNPTTTQSKMLKRITKTYSDRVSPTLVDLSREGYATLERAKGFYNWKITCEGVDTIKKMFVKNEKNLAVLALGCKYERLLATYFLENKEEGWSDYSI